MSINKLVAQIKEKECPIVVGLDPRIEQIPQAIKKPYFDRYGHTLEAVKHAFIEFNRGIIDAVHDLVPAIKPQIAFYEKYDALDILKETIDYIHSKKCLVILDAKRNDIGSTAAAYASNVFDHYKADCVTLNAYLGIDGILSIF